jgi:hypothetical protein
MAAPPGWTIQQITKGAGHNPASTKVSGDRVVWLETSGIYSIQTWKVGDSAPTTISTPGVQAYNPSISAIASHGSSPTAAATPRS